jgi:hypothetical protein
MAILPGAKKSLTGLFRWFRRYVTVPLQNGRRLRHRVIGSLNHPIDRAHESLSTTKKTWEQALPHSRHSACRRNIEDQFIDPQRMLPTLRSGAARRDVHPNSPLLQPSIYLDCVKTDKPSYLEVWNPAFTHQSLHVTVGHSQHVGQRRHVHELHCRPYG